jgi:hypothetical protein
MNRSICVAILLLLSSCTKEASGVLDAGSTAVVPDSGPAMYELTAEKLDQFTAYRTKLHAEVSALPADKRRLISAREAVRATLAQNAGIGGTEALRIESMVFQVMAQRSLAKNGDAARSLEKLRGNLDRMHPDQRVDALKDLEELEVMLKEMSTANALRSSFGDRNVDLILSKADQLMPIYEQALSDERGGSQLADGGADQAHDAGLTDAGHF